MKTLKEDGDGGDGLASNDSSSAGTVSGDTNPTFAGSRVFDVDSTFFNGFRRGKNRYHNWSKYLPDGDDKKKIREYVDGNAGKSVIVRDRNTSAMMYLKR